MPPKLPQPGQGCQPDKAFRDHLALVLGDGSHDVQREPVGLRHVAAEEVHAAFEQAGDEGDVARQPVELGDEQRGAGLLAWSRACCSSGRSARFPLSTSTYCASSLPRLAATKRVTAACCAYMPSPRMPYLSVDTRR